jgi:hypothetical protein
MPRSNNDLNRDSRPSATLRGEIHEGIEAIGKWNQEDAQKIANALHAEARKDPLIKRIDAVRAGTDAIGTESVFAIYSPHGPIGPFFHASVKVETALKAPVLEKAASPGLVKDGFLDDPAIIKKPVSELTEKKGPLVDHHAIVMHRTAGDSAASALSAFKSGIGAHFIIDKDGSIYQTASLDKQVSHAGKIKSRCDEEGTCLASEQKVVDAMGWAPGRIHDHESRKTYPDRYPLNADSVGIEVVGNYSDKTKAWDAPTAEQKASIGKLTSMLKNEFSLNDKDIYQHDIISYKTKGEGAGLYVPDTPAVAAPDSVSRRSPHR